MIVLHELLVDAGVRQHVLAIGFHEEAARVLVDSRLHHQHAGQPGFDDFQVLSRRGHCVRRARFFEE